MQSPPQIEFENMSPSQEIKDAVGRHIAELEQLSGRITACRVVLKAPSHHHREGGLYEVHIHLLLPDEREVNVEREPMADERRANLEFAVNDAFKRARRQLQDQVSRMRR